MKETIQYIFVLGRIYVSEGRKHDVICKGTVYQNIVQSLLYCFTLISGLDKFCLTLHFLLHFPFVKGTVHC